MTITKAEAAARLGIKEREVASAVHAPEGVLITTVAGVVYVDVPADRPDGDGKTGLMFRRLPNPDGVYSFPCFVPVPPPEVGDPDLDDAVDAAPGVPDGSVEDVLAWVFGEEEDPLEGWEDRAAVALAAEDERPKPRKGVVEALEVALDDAVDAAPGDAD